MSPPTESIDDFPLDDLRRVVATLVAEMSRLGGLVEAKDGELSELKASNAALVAEVRELKDEIARLKGLPPRPRFQGRPSGMEQATSKLLGKKGRKRGSKVDKLTVTSQVRLKAQVPPGARFRGYEDVLVQDLRISVEVV